MLCVAMVVMAVTMAKSAVPSVLKVVTRVYDALLW